MKKTLLFVLLIASIICIFAISVSAAETKTIDGLTYYINNKTAQVTNANKSCTLETVIIPETIKDSSGNDCVVNRINENAFNGNKTIKYVSLPPTITFIGPAAFHSCSSLEFVDFNDNPNDVDFNNWGHFMNCTSLTSIDLPDTLTIARFVQPSNARSPILVTEAGISIDLIHVAFLNAESEISVTPAGIVNLPFVSAPPSTERITVPSILRIKSLLLASSFKF